MKYKYEEVICSEEGFPSELSKLAEKDMIYVETIGSSQHEEGEWPEFNTLYKYTILVKY